MKKSSAKKNEIEKRKLSSRQNKLVGWYIGQPGEHIQLFTKILRWPPEKKFHSLKWRPIFCKTAPAIETVFLKTAPIVWCYFWSLQQHGAQRRIPKMA